jgi:hypothetical protein
MKTSATIHAPPHARRRFHTKKRTTATNADAGRNGCELGRVAADCALTAIVSCVDAAAPEGVKVVGLNEQLAFAGNPEQAKLTVEANPFCGVTVRVVAPAAPE